MVGDEIEFRINRIEGDFVKVAVRAPRHLPIYRNEVYRQVKETNLAAARKPGGVLPKLSLPSTLEQPNRLAPRATDTTRKTDAGSSD